VHLPGINGIDLAISLRARYPKIRVSLFSGRAQTADLIQEARQKGDIFDDVIAKPVHPSFFLEMAARLESDAAI
jgi:CheY-like chemotaxis protein